MITLQQIDHAVGNTRGLPAFHQKLRHRRRLLTGLEHHAVARQQCRYDMAIGQVRRKIERPQHGDDTVRPVLHPQLPRGSGFFETAGALLIGLNRNRDFAEGRGHFGLRVPARLAVFAADQFHQFRLALLHHRAEPLQQGNAIIQRCIAPAGERSPCRQHRLLHLRGAGGLALPHQVTTGRIGGTQHIAFTALPQTVDQ